MVENNQVKKVKTILARWYITKEQKKWVENKAKKEAVSESKFIRTLIEYFKQLDK